MSMLNNLQKQNSLFRIILTNLLLYTGKLSAYPPSGKVRILFTPPEGSKNRIGEISSLSDFFRLFRLSSARRYRNLPNDNAASEFIIQLIKSFPDRRTIENSDLCANSPKKL